MMIKESLKELDLTIDDVRWYLSSLLTEKVLFYKNKTDEIIRLFWSGKLESEMYNMEELFLEKLEDEYNREIKDEAAILEICTEISKAKKKRFK